MAKKVLIVIALLAIVLFVYWYINAFMPLILALVTAMILEPVIRLLQRYAKIHNRFIAVTIVFTAFVAMLGTFFYLAITRLVNEAVQLVQDIPQYINDMNVFIDNLIENLDPVYADELQNQIDNVYHYINDFSSTTIELSVNYVLGVPQFVLLTLVYLIALFLISMDLPRIRDQFYRLFKEETANKVYYMSQNLKRVFVGFFKAQFLVSIVIFIVTYIGLLMISPSNALLMAVVIWIIDFIPIIGSIIILAPWAGYHLIVGDTAIGIQLLVLAGVLLTLRRTLEPKIMGDQIGLSPLPTLISLYLGLYFLGVIGVIVGPLIFIALKSATQAGIIRLNYKF